jgi:DNA-binding NarL/FixJ family response regulator
VVEGTGGRLKPSIVLADDDHRFRSIVRALLEADGYRVIAEAGDAEATLEAAATHHADVLVVDLVMDGSDGLSTVEELLTIDPSRPVIVISSLFDPIVEQAAVRLGAWYLEKVEGVEALEHAIDMAASVSHRG